MRLRFFIQDDWKATQKLTLNLGLRYEFSTPYEDRYNRLQIANFTPDTGVNVPAWEKSTVSMSLLRKAQAVPTPIGTTWDYAGRSLPAKSKTVLRAGAGIYYGVNYATSYQDLGPAYRKDLTYYPTLDNGLTQFATLQNPFRYGNVAAQGTKYGILNGWGLPSTSSQSNTFRNAEIYQWAASVQHELPGSQVIEVAYSANRSTHLPDAYVHTRNYVSTVARDKIRHQRPLRLRE